MWERDRGVGEREGCVCVCVCVCVTWLNCHTDVLVDYLLDFEMLIIIIIITLSVTAVSRSEHRPFAASDWNQSQSDWGRSVMNMYRWQQCCVYLCVCVCVSVRASACVRRFHITPVSECHCMGPSRSRRIFFFFFFFLLDGFWCVCVQKLSPLDQSPVFDSPLIFHLSLFVSLAAFPGAPPSWPLPPQFRKPLPRLLSNSLRLLFLSSLLAYSPSPLLPL